MPEMINPLRYPGAKRFLVNYIDELLFANNLYGCCYFEPYAGSAAVGLKLLQRDSIDTLILCEKDILIYAFWKCVVDMSDELCDKINNTPITVETWKQLSYLRDISQIGEVSILELGFAGLFFNRTNFSGILKANPIGGINQSSKYSIDCRFNKSRIIGIINNIGRYKERIEVYYDDAIDFMKSQSKRFFQQSCFAYFDPPYYQKGSKLYRHYYRNRGHIELSKYVKAVHNLDWIISYDDDPFICSLYGGSGAKYRPLFMDYSCAPNVRTRGEELLISNLPLPPFHVEKARSI